MPYLRDFDEGFDDESLAALTEDDDDERWQSDGFGEAERSRIGPKYQRDQRSNGQTAWRTPRRQHPRPSVAGVQGAAITQAGPGGRPQVRFEKPVATKDSVEDLSRELNRDVLAALAGIKHVDRTLDKNTSILDKKVAALEAIVAKANKQAQEQAQMGMLLPLLLSRAPELESITFEDDAGGKPRKVSSSVFKKADNTLLFLMLAMGGGGGLFGGGESGGGSGGFLGGGMMLPLLLFSGVLGGGLGK